MASKNKNVIMRLQHWMESEKGQIFLNYAYNWGAAIVILGTLFKITHIPGANLMLFVGMGTEVLVFFISAFDRPAGVRPVRDDAEEATGQVAVQGGQSVVQGGPVIIGGYVPQGGASVQPADGNAQQPVAVQPVAAASDQPAATQPMGGMPFDSRQLAECVSAMNAEMMQAARDAMNPEMKEAAEAYVEELKKLTETLSRVSDQAECMTRDAKEMDNLNRTLTGINTIYEMQLKSISTQVGTIDQINEQTRRMARQIEELNAIYNRMIQAMTVNMRNNGGMNMP